jgi:hypothetical protein
MEKRIKITSDPKEIQKHLEKLYNKIDLQLLLHEANISQKNNILSKEETAKLRKYNLNFTTSVS